MDHRLGLLVVMLLLGPACDGTDQGQEDDDTGSTADDDAAGDDDTGDDDDTSDDDAGDDDAAGPNPVAVCVVDSPFVPPPNFAVNFIGTNSHDPNGHAIIEYDWSWAARPAGSDVDLECSGEPDCGPVRPDLAGTYTARLEIENEVGGVDSCTVDVVATPTQQLWIELFWTHPDDDMDLHLLAPGGQLETETDCYFENCHWLENELDWGVVGFENDDPLLVMDDIVGTGPEVTHIVAPAEGSYTVVVQDYEGTTGDSPETNPVTVNVHIHGQLTWSGTREQGSEGAYTPFCEVDIPSGAVLPL